MKVQMNMRIDKDLLAELQEIRRRDDVSVSEQIRRAIMIWIALKS